MRRGRPRRWPPASPAAGRRHALGGGAVAASGSRQHGQRRGRLLELAALRRDRRPRCVGAAVGGLARSTSHVPGSVPGEEVVTAKPLLGRPATAARAVGAEVPGWGGRDPRGGAAPTTGQSAIGPGGRPAAGSTVSAGRAVSRHAGLVGPLPAGRRPRRLTPVAAGAADCSVRWASSSPARIASSQPASCAAACASAASLSGQLGSSRNSVRAASMRGGSGRRAAVRAPGRPGRGVGVQARRPAGRHLGVGPLRAARFVPGLAGQRLRRVTDTGRRRPGRGPRLVLRRRRGAAPRSAGPRLRSRQPAPPGRRPPPTTRRAAEPGSARPVSLCRPDGPCPGPGAA